VCSAFAFPVKSIATKISEHVVATKRMRRKFWLGIEMVTGFGG
jgi:hypothetical protein